jgi:hypothetical protein
MTMVLVGIGALAGTCVPPLDRTGNGAIDGYGENLASNPPRDRTGYRP